MMMTHAHEQIHIPNFRSCDENEFHVSVTSLWQKVFRDIGSNNESQEVSRGTGPLGLVPEIVLASRRCAWLYRGIIVYLEMQGTQAMGDKQLRKVGESVSGRI